METILTEADWDTLLTRISNQKCTPFLGAGVCFGVLPLACEVADKWAKEFGYPLSDCSDLARVAQFLAVERRDFVLPKMKIAELFKEIPPPNFKDPNEPHGVLANLPLPIYITTNYDDFMVQALRSRGKDPKLVLCRWNRYIKDQKSRPSFESTIKFIPSPANPVVFHLHGYREVPESLVLTEDDYLDFLVNISRDQKLIPPSIQGALSSSLLFIGYRLADWDFRVIFRGVIGSIENSLSGLNVAVQLPPEDSKIDPKKAQEYLSKYFANTRIQVYWGTAKEFLAELKKRWEEKFGKKE